MDGYVKLGQPRKTRGPGEHHGRRATCSRVAGDGPPLFIPIGCYIIARVTEAIEAGYPWLGLLGSGAAR